MAGRVDDVEPDAAVVDRRLLGEDGDALLALEVARVEDAVDHRLVGAEGAGLAEQRVDEGGLAVVDVGDDGEIPQVGTREAGERVAVAVGAVTAGDCRTGRPKSVLGAPVVAPEPPVENLAAGVHDEVRQQREVQVAAPGDRIRGRAAVHGDVVGGARGVREDGEDRRVRIADMPGRRRRGRPRRTGPECGAAMPARTAFEAAVP